MSDLPTIQQALTATMRDVQAVGKDGENKQQGYSFRGVDGVVNAVGPAFRNHGVIVFPTVLESTYAVGEYGKNRTPMRECTLKVEFRFVGPAGDSETAVVMAEANDSGDKATAKAHSVAYRTALLQVLAIPTHEPDPDSHRYERAAPPPLASPVVIADLHARLNALPETLRVEAKKQFFAELGRPSDLIESLAGAAEALVSSWEQQVSSSEEVPA